MLVRQDIFKLSCHSKPNAFAGRDLVGSFLTWNKKEMNTLFFWQVIQKIPLLECKWSASIGECSVGGLCKITSMFVQHTDNIWLPKYAKSYPK